ncbi:alpha/beta fold hydrolase [Gordonia rubripertincta]|uniref:Alpha/beta fold hydrolase n=3 Tax=Gordonia rubripertincta TaxID=36822 RepID=A0AAW4G6X8_GORRU|nr:alpha/beta fold hydrolase [Gordonia rubripertincta]MBM7278908.1 alpha/beta fold hydrolase [Gordonia rubripertincta]QMU19735.1 alpha/beta fold hydrolase [Gordonia rubripertincta]
MTQTGTIRPTTVLISPAMSVPARVYRRLVEALTGYGLEVRVVPRRGVEEGAVPPSRTADWSYEDEAADLADAIAAARAEIPGARVLVVGHSLGAQLVAMVAQTSDHTPDGIVAIGASLPSFRHYGIRGVPLGAIGAAVAPVSAIVGHWPRRGFGGPTPRTLMRQWARMVLTGRAPFTLDRSIETPTLSVRLDGDEIVTDGAAAAFDAAFSPEAITHWRYDDAQCPAGGITTHIGWLRTPEIVGARIAAWWDAHTTVSPAVTESGTL